MGIEMLTSDFLEIFGPFSPVAVKEMPDSPFLRKPMKGVHRISYKTKCPWKNLKWSGNPSSNSVIKLSISMFCMIIISCSN